jgi:hypothetical protein
LKDKLRLSGSLKFQHPAGLQVLLFTCGEFAAKTTIYRLL